MSLKRQFFPLFIPSNNATRLQCNKFDVLFSITVNIWSMYLLCGTCVYKAIAVWLSAAWIACGYRLHSPPPKEAGWTAPPQAATHNKHILFLKQTCPRLHIITLASTKCLSLLCGSMSAGTSACLLTSTAKRGRDREKGGKKINLILQNYQIIWNYGFLVWAFSPCLPSCANQFKQTQRANTRWTPQ